MSFTRLELTFQARGIADPRAWNSDPEKEVGVSARGVEGGEDAEGVGGGAGGNGVGRLVVDVGKTADNLDDVSRFVAAPAEGDRGKVGGVGLDDDAVEGDVAAQHVGQGGFFVGKGAADAEHEAGEGEQPLGLVGRAAEAMEDARQRLGAEGFHKGIELVEGGPLMDDDGQTVA